jgi:cell division protein FtsB
MIAADTPLRQPSREQDSPDPAARQPSRTRHVVRYVLVAVTAMLLVDAIVGEKGLLTLLQARKEFAAVERALQQSRDDNQSLRDTARRLREDPSAIEAVARRELGLIKPGEKLFIVRDIAPPR